MHRIIFGTIAAFVGFVQSFDTTLLSAAEAPQVTSCDLLAANPEDPNKITQGVATARIDAPAAVAACESAIAEQPGVARLQYQYGLALVRAHRRAEAMVWLRKAADQGYSEAQADLAYVIRGAPEASGYRSREEALTAAFHLEQLAAEQGNLIAMADLGWHYMYGLGVERDYDEALKWLRRGVEHDERFSEEHLGEMYKHGWGVPRDDVEAVKWFRRSADQGYRGAQYSLALMLLAGRGVARDPAAAEELLSLAAEQEHSGARRELEKLRAERNKQ
jgi:TPR repeat protein